MSYDSITIPASGYVSLKKNGLSLSNIRMASIITYSRIDPPKPFCVYGNSTVAYVYGEPGTVITELKVRFWYWLNSKRPCLQQIYAGGDYKNCDDLPAGESATVYSSAINRPSTSKTWYLFCYASDSFKTQIAIDVTNPCNICYRILNRLDGNNQWTTWASK